MPGVQNRKLRFSEVRQGPRYGRVAVCYKGWPSMKGPRPSLGATATAAALEISPSNLLLGAVSTQKRTRTRTRTGSRAQPLSRVLPGFLGAAGRTPPSQLPELPAGRGAPQTGEARHGGGAPQAEAGGGSGSLGQAGWRARPLKAGWPQRRPHKPRASRKGWGRTCGKRSLRGQMRRPTAAGHKARRAPPGVCGCARSTGNGPRCQLTCVFPASVWIIFHFSKISLHLWLSVVWPQNWAAIG